MGAVRPSTGSRDGRPDPLRQRPPQTGKKKVSNEEWESPSDPDARITKLKDGRTHLAYKAEQAIIEAEVHHATEADTATLVLSLESAQEHLAHVWETAAAGGAGCGPLGNQMPCLTGSHNYPRPPEHILTA